MKRLLFPICLTALSLAGCGQSQMPDESSSPTAAGTPAAPADMTGAVPSAGLVVTNAHIIDGTGNFIDRGAVVIRDGRIVSVSADTPDVPGALVIDAEGRSVMPGFIDAHRHLIRGNPDQWLESEAAERMQEFLDAGFTTVLSALDAEKQILELRQRLADGTIQGPRLFALAVAPLAAATGERPQGDPARYDNARPPLRPTEPAPAIPDEQTVARVHQIKEAGFDGIKTFMIASPGGPEERTLKLIADEAKKVGIPVFTHAVTVQDTLAAVRAGVTVLAHTPHIGQLTEDQARTIATAGIPMMSTLGIFAPFYDENNQPVFRDALPFPWETLSSAGQGPVNARLMWQQGLVYGYGTDTSFLPRRTLAHELHSLSLVFSARDIVKIMTQNAAAAVLHSDELGTLEPGKTGDLVMIDGDPLENIDNVLNVRMVVKDGQIVVDKRAMSTPDEV